MLIQIVSSDLRNPGLQKGREGLKEYLRDKIGDLRVEIVPKNIDSSGITILCYGESYPPASLIDLMGKVVKENFSSPGMETRLFFIHSHEVPF